MKVAIDLPLRELLQAALDYFATTPALDVVSLRYTSRDEDTREMWMKDTKIPLD